MVDIGTEKCLMKMNMTDTKLFFLEKILAKINKEIYKDKLIKLSADQIT